MSILPSQCYIIKIQKKSHETTLELTNASYTFNSRKNTLKSKTKYGVENRTVVG